jgi:hypothetical protein
LDVDNFSQLKGNKMDNVNCVPKGAGDVTVIPALPGKPLVIGSEQNTGTNDSDGDDFSGSPQDYSGAAKSGKEIV